MQSLEQEEFASKTVYKQKWMDLILVIQDKTNMILLKRKGKEQQFLPMVKVCSLFTK